MDFHSIAHQPMSSILLDLSWLGADEEKAFLCYCPVNYAGEQFGRLFELFKISWRDGRAKKKKDVAQGCIRLNKAVEVAGSRAITNLEYWLLDHVLHGA